MSDPKTGRAAHPYSGVPRAGSSEIIIRVGQASESAKLDQAMAAPPGVYAGLLDVQAAGEATLLVLEINRVPVGVGLLRWSAQDDAVRTSLGDLPELTNLHVVATHRSQGLGRMIIESAYARAQSRGHGRLGIGVDAENSGAIRLYESLGFVDTGLLYLSRWEWVDGDGALHSGADATRYLVRESVVSIGTSKDETGLSQEV